MQAGDPAIATALRKKVRSAYAAAAKAASRATPPREQAKNARTSEQVLIGPADPRRAAYISLDHQEVARSNDKIVDRGGSFRS